MSASADRSAAADVRSPGHRDRALSRWNPKCGSTMRIALIARHQTEVIRLRKATAGQFEKILRHCGLWDELSARAPMSTPVAVEG